MTHCDSHSETHGRVDSSLKLNRVVVTSVRAGCGWGAFYRQPCDSLHTPATDSRVSMNNDPAPTVPATNKRETCAVTGVRSAITVEARDRARRLCVWLFQGRCALARLMLLGGVGNAGTQC